MTRCESPNGAVEFSYNFPVASTSKRPASTRARSPRRHAPSPLPPTRWDSDDEDDEAGDDYDYSYRAHTTGNQWARAPSPSFTPSHLSPYDIYATSALPSSYESERSVLSSFCPRQQHAHNKIRKARRSVDEPAPPPPPLSPTYSSGSSAPSSPFSVLSDDFSDMEEEGCVEEEGMDVEGEEEGRAHDHTPHALKKQWAALSLRVRFGVFRAKRRMRDRVLSL
ncbi:hypothetical protein MKEN_01467300 [Mycena kentingensis (nom. inval.)]|nr:hypothetical protein MKEN_01467300 [Mycena kentingensis (nom. inval.)]